MGADSSNKKNWIEGHGRRHGHEFLKKSGHWRIFVVSKRLYFEVRKVEMFGLFEYLINPPKVEMPRMVKASPILFHFKFHSRSPYFYLEYISFLGWKKFLLSILLSRNKIRPNLFKNHLFTYFRCRFREKSHSDLLKKCSRIGRNEGFKFILEEGTWKLSGSYEFLTISLILEGFKYFWVQYLSWKWWVLSIRDLFTIRLIRSFWICS